MFLVAFLLSFQPLSTDLYLPSIQAITADLSLSVVQAQGTLMGLLLGFALSQIAWGLFSDRLGRRRILLAGSGLYALSGLVCAWADHGLTLLLARVLMGCGLAAMVVCARAIVRDLFDDIQGQQAFARALTGMALVAALSGVVGGFLAQHISWRAVMGILSGLGLTVCALTLLWFEESQPSPAIQTASWWTQLWGSWGRLLRSRAFVLNTGLAAFTYTEAVVFMGGSALVMVRHHGVSPSTFGLIMTAFSSCFLLGALSCRWVLKRGGRTLALRVGSGLSASGALALCGVALWPGEPLVTALVAAQMTYMLGHGFNQVCSQAGAVAPFPKEAGSAAALSGTLMILCCVVLGQLQAWVLTHWTGALPVFGAFHAGMAATLAWRLSRMRTPLQASLTA